MGLDVRQAEAEDTRSGVRDGWPDDAPPDHPLGIRPSGVGVRGLVVGSHAHPYECDGCRSGRQMKVSQQKRNRPRGVGRTTYMPPVANVAMTPIFLCNGICRRQSSGRGRHMTYRSVTAFAATVMKPSNGPLMQRRLPPGPKSQALLRGMHCIAIGRKNAIAAATMNAMEP